MAPTIWWSRKETTHVNNYVTMSGSAAVLWRKIQVRIGIGECRAESLDTNLSKADREGLSDNVYRSRASTKRGRTARVWGLSQVEGTAHAKVLGLE